MAWRYVAARDIDAPFLMRLLGVWRYRTLLRRVAARDLRLRYAGTTLGRVWAVVYPLLLVAFYTAVFTTVFRGRLGPSGADAAPERYALYVVAGLLPWVAFTEVATRAVQTMAEHRSLVKHVQFPVQILPLGSVYGAALPHCVALLALAAFASWTGGSLSLSPVALAVTLVSHALFLSGIAWLLGALGAMLRDVRELLAIALTAGMFITPIFYVEADAPAPLRLVLQLNPLTHFVRAYREAFLIGPASHPESPFIALAVAGATLLLGFWLFERTRVFLADIL